jgi:hypothetical protein
MTEQLILRELHNLPESLKMQVLKYVQILKKQSEPSQQETQETPRKRRKAGSAEGKYVLAPDFDAPLEDFKEYMQ